MKIISVGRAHWKKGYGYALDAMKFLKEADIDFRNSIIGLQENEELLFQRSDLDLNDKVKFLPRLKFKDVINKIHMADILLLPSIEEGIANVALEAMAVGTLVVSTDCGGMNEVINDGQNGFIVPVRNYEAMAKKIQVICNLSHDEYITITNEARKTIENDFGVEQMKSNMKSLYKKVVNL